MGAPWVDFKQVREEVAIEQVLKHYGVELKFKGNQAHGFCPLPTHPTHEGKRRSPSFSVNLKKGIWQCFGCGAKGNVLDLATRLEGHDPDNKEHLRKTALLLQERFLNTDNDSGTGGVRPGGSRVVERSSDKLSEECSKYADELSSEPDSNDSLPRVINSPMDFELKRLDANHPYLSERGLSAETIQTFGLGFCKQGMMKDRIAIPIRNLEGYLVGYAGRLIDEGKICEEHPKYKLPGDREREGIVHTFRKSHLLFNANRIPAPVEDLVIVEGFFGVFWLHQHGWSNAVALMGASCSLEQAALIRGLTHFDSRVWIMPDGDTAGERCAQSLFSQVAPDRFVRWVKLDAGVQPEDCSTDQLHDLLNLPVR